MQISISHIKLAKVQKYSVHRHKSDCITLKPIPSPTNTIDNNSRTCPQPTRRS